MITSPSVGPLGLAGETSPPGGKLWPCGVGAATAAPTSSWKSTTFDISRKTELMMEGPPAAPATSTSRNTGMKAASPSMPTMNALCSMVRPVARAIAYICHPMATLWIWAAKLPVQRDSQKVR